VQLSRKRPWSMENLLLVLGVYEKESNEASENTPAKCCYPDISCTRIIMEHVWGRGLIKERPVDYTVIATGLDAYTGVEMTGGNISTLFLVWLTPHCSSAACALYSALSSTSVVVYYLLRLYSRHDRKASFWINVVRCYRDAALVVKWHNTPILDQLTLARAETTRKLCYYNIIINVLNNWLTMGQHPMHSLH